MSSAISTPAPGAQNVDAVAIVFRYSGAIVPAQVVPTPSKVPPVAVQIVTDVILQVQSAGFQQAPTSDSEQFVSAQVVPVPMKTPPFHAQAVAVPSRQVSFGRQQAP
jgi:hypothetical protein